MEAGQFVRCTDCASVDLHGGEEVIKETGGIRALGKHRTSDRETAEGEDGEV